MSGNLLAPPQFSANSLLNPGAAITSYDPYDYTNRYNTPLSPADEAGYQAWITKLGRSADNYDYDMRGAFKAGAGADESSGHYPDTFKKPNHPTFSDQSKYHGVDGFMGGSWGGTDKAPTFTPGPANLSMMSPTELRRYFQQREPTATLVLPTP